MSTAVKQSTPPTPVADSLRRVLGPFDATCVVVGAIIGVGIFFTPSRVAQLAGSGELALLAWTLGGAIALLGALTFASLGSVYNGAGAQYEILRDAYGPLPAFVFVFCNATAIQAGAIAIIATICVKNLSLAAAGIELADGRLLAGCTLLIAGLVAANCLGVRWGSGIQNLTVVAKLAVLLAIAALAASSASAPAGTAAAGASSISPPAGLGLVAVLFAACVPAFFSYGGWQHALWIAGEVRNPTRNVPLAILVGVVLVVAVYLLTNWAYLHLLGHAAVAGSTTLAADAVGTVWPAWGRRAIAGGVAISAFGVLNAQLLSGPRLIYRLASDGRFFSIFGRVGHETATPVPAILLLGGLALVLLLAAGAQAVEMLLTGVVFVDGVFFALTGLAPLILRPAALRAGRPWAGYGYPLVPLLFVLGEIGIVLGAYGDRATRSAAHIGLAWIAAAVVLYLVRFAGASARRH